MHAGDEISTFGLPLVRHVGLQHKKYVFGVTLKSLIALAVSSAERQHNEAHQTSTIATENSQILDRAKQSEPTYRHE